MDFVKTLFNWLKITVIAVVSLLTLIVIWYLWTQRIQDANYPVIDTGIWPSSEAYHAPVWLDNERLLILTQSNNKPSKKPQFYVVYNVKTKQISNTHLVDVRILCDRGGQFVYSTNDPNDYKMYRGNLEQAHLNAKPEGDWMMDEHFDCDWVPLATSTAAKIKYIYPYLLKLHGNNYLEKFENRQMLYHEHFGDAGVPYPPGDTSYSEYLDAYIASNNNYDPAKPESSHFWVIKRNGQVAEIPYPNNMFISNRTPTDHDIYPIRPGYLIEYFGEGFDYKTNGLYLISEGKLKHVLSGFIKDLAISPNGCIAAFGYAKNVKEDLATIKDWVVVDEPKTAVKLIDFCAVVSK